MPTPRLLAAVLLSVVAGCATDTSETGAGGAPMKCDLGLVSSVLASSSSGAGGTSASASSAGSTGAGGSASSTSSVGAGGSAPDSCCGVAEIVDAATPVPAGEEVAVIVVCPAGSVLVSGGCRWGNVPGAVFPTESRPVNSGWRCGGASNGDDEETLIAFALCAAE